MVEDEGVSGINRVNAALRGDNSKDDKERRSIPPTKDDTTHLEEDEGGGKSPPLGTSKRTIQLPIGRIKVGKLNLRSFRRKREEEKRKKKEKQDDEDNVSDELRGDPPSGTPLSDKEDVLTASSSTCTELLNGRLLLSGYEFALNAENLRKKKITHIVNMAGEECPNKFEASFSYRTYYVKDDLREEIFYTLLDASHFIEAMLSSDEGNKILVHCKKGVSRSVIIVIFFLMTRLELSFGDAFDLVKKRRPLSNPNLSFVSQLLRLFELRRLISSGGKEGTSLVEPPQCVHPPGEVTLIFRIDAAGKALTLTNLMNHFTDVDACTNSDSVYTKPTEIDERFNYVLTRDFREFYLLLLDPTFEEVCTPLLERFAQICRSFFHGGPANSTDMTQPIVRSDVGEFMQRLRLDTQMFIRLPCNDEAYLKLQKVLQGRGGENSMI
ncbi:Dual specificity phosphatase [Plasmodium coatneyi]|uniref:Dual specificity phosphatase n=1 Tax=Plasmodium coatneyi TaxID=208452 RepID=A0A1B1DST0_9APIC|nr:Dual specificity phosphatase [Plasmodium coatneyi]ANQ05689.1 Dual specificity phosphatase [Plasmodium coatneyi]